MSVTFFRPLAALLICLTSLLPAGYVQAGPLEVGILPNVSARVLMQQYHPMQTYLDTRLERKTAFSSAPDWSSFYQRAGEGRYDVIVAASNVARLIQKNFGYQPSLSYQPDVPGLFVTLATQQETSPQKIIAGQTLAFANPASLVAIEGLAWLKTLGIETDKNLSMLRVKGEDSVGNILLRGDAVAGIMSMGEFMSHPEDIRKQLKIHTRFKDVPSFVVMTSPKLSAVERDALTRDLLFFAQSTPEGVEFFKRTGFKGIVPVDEAKLRALDQFNEATREALLR